MQADIIGVDLGGTKALILAGRTEARANTGPDFAPADLDSLLRDFIVRHGIEPSAIGIAVPGLVDRHGRIAACDVLPHFTGWDPAKALARWQARITVANDVKAALAEEMHDAPQGATVGVVMAGTAIGAAFIAEGQPLLGASGWAGEVGYLPLVANGRVQRLDELAGGSFIAAGLGLDAEEMARRAESGDPTVLGAIGDGGRALGLGLAAVINLLNPSRLAVGGGAVLLPGYWPAAQMSAQQHSIPELWKACALAPVRAGARVAALGVIRMAAR